MSLSFPDYLKFSDQDQMLMHMQAKLVEKFRMSVMIQKQRWVYVHDDTTDPITVFNQTTYTICVHDGLVGVGVRYHETVETIVDLMALYDELITKGLPE